MNGVRLKDEDDRLESGSVQEEEKKKIWGIPDNVRLEREMEKVFSRADLSVAQKRRSGRFQAPFDWRATERVVSRANPFKIRED